MKQERFVFDSVLGDSPGDDDEEQVWPVPLTVTAEGAGLTATLVNAATDTVTVATPSDPDWFKVNPDQTGFYRVNYTDEDWDRLVPVITTERSPRPTGWVSRTTLTRSPRRVCSPSPGS